MTATGLFVNYITGNIEIKAVEEIEKQIIIYR